MTNVYACPPWGLTAWELSWNAPGARSQMMFSGKARTSSFQRPHRLATATITGIGSDRNGAGYVENLKRLLDGGEHLVRVEALAPLWVIAAGRLDLTNAVLEWSAESDDLLWSYSGDDVLFLEGDYGPYGEPTTDGVWPAIQVTGLPANTVVARPSQYLTVTDGETTQGGHVLAPATSDADGVATIRLFEAVTASGYVTIGGRESIVFEALNMPRSVQPARGTFGYTWEFREVFEDEYESWTELNPWA
jgi:hypothetical protein